MPNNFQPHIPDFQRGERLSAARLNELADAIAMLLWHKQQSSNATFGTKPPLEIIGKLDDDLPAATNFATAPGTAVMSVWFKDQNGNLIDSGRNENIKQRFESAEAKAAGDEVRAAWIEGEWVALPSGGSGGGHTIWFTINDVLCPNTDYVAETTLVVTATWYNRSCTGTPPGANYDGTYNIYDLCNYMQGLTPTDLVNGTGRATYHYPLTGYCEPRWVIDDLCPQPVCE
jgi:hypothetical protein